MNDSKYRCKVTKHQGNHLINKAKQSAYSPSSACPTRSNSSSPPSSTRSTLRAKKATSPTENRGAYSPNAPSQPPFAAWRSATRPPKRWPSPSAPYSRRLSRPCKTSSSTHCASKSSHPTHKARALPPRSQDTEPECYSLAPALSSSPYTSRGTSSISSPLASWLAPLSSRCRSHDSTKNQTPTTIPSTILLSITL